MQAKLPFRVCPSDQIKPGQLVLSGGSGEVIAPGIVVGGAGAQLMVVPLAGPEAGVLKAIQFRECLLLTSEAHIKTPILAAAYTRTPVITKKITCVLTESGVYFAISHGGEIYINTSTGSLDSAQYGFCVSNWQIVVEGFDEVFAEG